MVTETEELQAKEFLKRAEIRTMRKDLLKLRESDALKERDKIATIKTLEEQLEERKTELAKEARAREEKIQREEVLTNNESQERIAEKDLKNYATEQERQQIFLLESQRLGFEKQADQIDKEKDPALKLEKNNLLLKKRDAQAKLNLLLEQEKKLEEEQKFIAEKAKTSTIASEKKGLEARRWDMDKEIQEIEKKRWEAEKQVENINASIIQVDKSSDRLVVEKNLLRDKILGADKSLREIYSVVMAREEEKRRGKTKEQIARKEELSKARSEENEKVQRQQWAHSTIPVPTKKIPIKSFEAEEEQRKKFLQDVEKGSQIGTPQKKSNIQ
ncbi:MAG: hypothetical protein A2358_02520 [Candidatus Staskawiczbacteria bacterium RIFOXYB1_FULL_37_44]|uniref:Uncharacterized protein n=1 Tax=Candidatus Staskawiczbacteria bacterium RIFOXYB1_FULL_37_44 TaxID=1802223 RepID=A0A1G2IVN2_9BACT|nr:MAG: hypothetical protein A2358_02520 [Candidatus Staskawiczbacteria bacterium RIFOXYB1_FULL_37_44]OGZ84293.1 MAG: hypothetical protein A2416_01440 [Candidatus Staskawiczbacteria bacterium RIFOXYC1_FULL_37_52]OGZ89146.1 MAG: hypothetical protein A2581_01380 [Candidatus Staskawiczbacteria bacterium RIFOXYD1_FULL_37_110]OGZ89431.1 MAG: hypothetical protein A2444_04000 [Candidatus Staskawiczbacteria bacterium RIFOXYC2_FULL_37_19]